MRGRGPHKERRHKNGAKLATINKAATIMIGIKTNMVYLLQGVVSVLIVPHEQLNLIENLLRSY